MYTYNLPKRFITILATATLLAVTFFIFYHSIVAATTANTNLTRITQTSGNDRSSQFPAVNSDGTKIIFSTDSDLLNQGIPNDQNEIWLYDSTTTELTRITTASGSDRDSYQASINGDGSKIVFTSDSDFLNQSIANDQNEIWLYDNTTNTLSRITIASGNDRDSTQPHISTDGNWVVFSSNSDFLSQGISTQQTELWLYNVSSQQLQRLTTASASDRSSTGARINGDGSQVVFTSDSDFLSQGIPFAQPEIWLIDTGDLNLTRITTASELGRLSFSADIDSSGENVVFHSDSDLMGQGIVSSQLEVWHYDVNSSQLTRITTADPALIPISDSLNPRISGNGRYITFQSANDFSGQHLMGAFEIYLHDRQTNNTERLTTTPTGLSGFINLSPDLGHAALPVVFHSSADFTNNTSQQLPNEIWLYDAPSAPIPNNWNSRTNMPTGRENAASAVVDSVIYVIGGWTDSDTAVVEAYDPHTDAWSTKASMNVSRNNLTAVTLNNKIYAIGGWSVITNTTAVEIYDPTTDSWSTGTPLPMGNNGFRAAVADGKIYTFGGWDGIADTNKVMMYDPIADMWTDRAPMPTARKGTAVATINNKIYVIGGNFEGTELDTVEIYDPATDTWSTGSPMPSPRSCIAAATINDQIYIVSDANERYDPATDSWEAFAPVLSPRYCLTAQAVDNVLYTFGGSNGGIPNASTLVEAYTPPIEDTNYAIYLPLLMK